MIKYFYSIVLAVIYTSCIHPSILALTNEEVFSQFQFNFITPGARAIALGGAFIGLADDATAVESNPAGLTILRTPEIFAEWRHTTYTTKQIYENLSADTDITREEFDDVVKSVPFLSVFYPCNWFVISFYRQELINYKSSYRTGSAAIRIPGTYDPSTNIVGVIWPVDAAVKLTVTNYGIGVAVQIFEKLSLAVSPRWSEMSMRAHSTRFETPKDYNYYTDFSDAEIKNESQIDGKDYGYGVNTGILWKPHPKVSLGAVYKTGTKYRTREAFSHPVYDSDITEFTLNIPDVFGAGIAVQATNFLTFTLDVIHIQYSDLLEDFDCVFSSKGDFTIDNATEIHGGLEYIWPLGKRFLSLRAGAYTDPDHTIRYTGSSEGKQNLFPGGSDQIHLTGGLGIAMSERFQIDVAANVAEQSTQLGLSAIYRF